MEWIAVDQPGQCLNNSQLVCIEGRVVNVGSPENFPPRVWVGVWVFLFSDEKLSLDKVCLDMPEEPG